MKKEFQDWTDTVNIAIKELMDTHKQFNVQGIINHINSQYPGYNINMINSINAYYY